MNFVVIGAGAWGTAFALHLSRVGNGVTLVPRRSEQARELQSRRENVEYLPGVPLPDAIEITESLEDALPEAEIIMLACPAQVLRATALRVRDAASVPSRFNLVISPAK